MADNKKYYYLKLKENFFDTDEMIILESMPDGYLYLNILLKLYLRSLKYDGRLMFNDRIPFNSNMLAQVTRHSVGVIEKAMNIFQELGLVEILDNGAIYISDIQNFIGASSTEADRIRNYRGKIERERKKMPCTNVQQMSDKSTPEIEIELEKELEIEKEKERNINKGAKAPDEGKPSKKSNKKKDNTIYYPDDKELNDTVIDFIEFRKNIKAPMTDRAVQIMVNKLNSMTDDRTEKIKILEQSMLNSWKGIFPLKGDSNYGYKGKDAKDKDNGEDYSDIGQSF